MVTARLAIGSVSTLALGALLLGSAPYLLGRKAGGSQAAPWGVVSALGVGQSVAAQSDDDRAQLLKLAALKSSAPAEPSSPPPPVEVVAPAPEAQPVAQMDAAPPVQPAAAEQPAAAPPEAAAPAEAPQQVATAEEPASSAIGQDDDAAKSDRVNINTASSAALDRLPGAGRIGHTIVSHRPYKSVKDLVSRRILRMSDFQKIQSRISID